MMNTVRELPEADRRLRQEDLGLVVITRRSDPPQTEKRTKKVHESQQTNRTTNQTTRAAMALERMTEPPTFKEVAIHELKRAAVWMPMLLSAGVGLVWANKRLFLKVG